MTSRMMSKMFGVCCLMTLMALTACSDPIDDELCTLDATGEEVSDCEEGQTDDGEACSCEEAATPECGNDVCEEGESAESCEADCGGDGPVCGDGVCEGDETAESCEADCGGDGPVCGDGACEEGESEESCAADCAVTGATFVIVEDLTGNPGGDFPGVDLDAVGLIKADGTESFAAAVSPETDVPCEGNLACDISAAVGAPDAVDGDGTCFAGGDPDPATFVALNQGIIILAYDEAIENGDSIHVYEIGSTECGRFDDDPYRVSVSVSDSETDAFIEIGTSDSEGAGTNIIPVTGL